jgi:hypothetical protein
VITRDYLRRPVFRLLGSSGFISELLVEYSVCPQCLSSALDCPLNKSSLQLAGESPFTPYESSILTGLKSTGNPLKVILLVLTREHLVEQLSFLVVVAITEFSLAVVWQCTLLSSNRLTIRYLGIASR